MQLSDVLSSRPLILVVDDTDGVRWTLARALLHAGYHVITASCAADALELLGRLRAQPNLAVIDLYMPEVSGEELATELSSLHPRLPIVFVSAYGHDPDEVLPGLLLEKPFRLEVLCRIITNLLVGGPRVATVHA